MNEENKNGFVKYHLPCPLCNSSDAVSVNADNSAYCFSCQEYMRDYDTDQQPTVVSKQQELKPITNQSDFAEIVDRNIKIDTCKKYSVSVIKSELKANALSRYTINVSLLVRVSSQVIVIRESA